MEFSGRLAAFPPAHLLQWAQNDRRTGAVVVRHGRREKRIYFQKGDVVAAASNDPTEYYGQRLLLYGHLTEANLLKALYECTQRGQRLGFVLRDLGLLSEDVIQATLRDHISDLVCGLFLWQRGVFFFQAEMPSHEEILPSPLHTFGLAMEGSRWIDEQARMRRLFIHDNITLRRRSPKPPPNLSPLERRVFSSVDGKGELRALHEATGGPWFRFLETCYALCLAEVLDIAHVASHAPETTAELSLRALLHEQAVAESEAWEGRHLSVPLEAIEGYCPRWLKKPGEKEIAELPELHRDFCRRLDGETPLSKLLAVDQETRARQFDFFVLELHRLRMVLVPKVV